MNKDNENPASKFDEEYGDFGWQRMLDDREKATKVSIQTVIANLNELKKQCANGTYVKPEPRPFRGNARFLDPIAIQRVLEEITN